MTIVARRGQAFAEARSRPVRFDRPPAGVSAGVDLLDDHHVIARLALELVVRTAEPADLPARWTTFPFGQEVDRTRGQLAPIQSRPALLDSFRREASVSATRGALEAGLPPGPVRVAYAIRWLELRDGRTRPAWASIVAGPVELLTGALASVPTEATDLTEAADYLRKGEITT
jgi:hypothetical protein